MAETHQAVVALTFNTPLQVETRPIPKAVQGSVVVKVLATYVLPYLKSVFEGKLPYTIAFPIVPCASCIARVHEVSPDATALSPGQLVLCDMTIRARDQPANVVLQGLHGGSTPSLMAQWADGSFAEYAVFPLENVFTLNEGLLFGEMGYDVEDLCMIPICNVPFGGLATLDVKPGEVVIVCPATGKFGGAAVATALAMGARVIAAGRNAKTLEALAGLYKTTGRIKTAVLSGDAEKDTKVLTEMAGNVGADCYVDFSPPQASTSTHIQACLGAVRPYGRIVFNGGSLGTVSIPYIELMIKNLQIHGKYMYEREHTERLVKMVEAGLLPLGKKVNFNTIGRFKLDQIQEALELAEKEPGWGKQVLLVP
ncbi:isopropanol dehydrogenase [Ilyonectria destructans]|nr:isopropanol dehydrogenase [Ilyonectria destructans]